MKNEFLLNDNLYKASLSEIRINICDRIAYKYMTERIVSSNHTEQTYNFIKEVFRYLLITKGQIYTRRRNEYLNNGVKPTDTYITYGGFQGDFEGCITHMKNHTGIQSMKTELYTGITMGKVIYQIMRMVYLNPAFETIVTNQLKINQK